MHTLGTIAGVFVLARARGITNIIYTLKMFSVTSVTHARRAQNRVSLFRALFGIHLATVRPKGKKKNENTIYLIQSNKYNHNVSFYCIVALSIRFGQHNNLVPF